MFLAAPSWGRAGEQVAAGGANPLKDAIRHAETYYTLGTAELDNLPPSEAGLRKIELAETLLATLSKSGSLSPDETERLGMRIQAVKTDLLDQLTAARGTLVGVFPLTPFVISPFADSGLTATYRLNDDPAGKAATDAAANLAAQLSEMEKKQGPLAVLVTSLAPPGLPAARDRALKHAVRKVFRGSPRFEVLGHADVASELSKTEWDRLQAGGVTSVPAGLWKAFGPRLLVVTLRNSDATEDVRAYAIEGQILETPGSPPQKPQKLFSAVGVARDRRDRMAWILWANAALLAAAYVVYGLIVRTHRAMAADSSWATLLALPLAAFFVGHSVPYAIAPLLGSIRLPPGSPALVSFWLPCLAGLGFFGAPLLAYWLIAPWLAQLWASLSPASRGGALFAAVGTGIAAHFAGPLLLYLDEHLLIELALMSTSVVALTYLLGRALDYADSLPLSMAFVPLALTMPAGAALLHAGAAWLGLATAAILATLAATLVWNSRRGKRRLTGGGTTIGPAGIAAGIPADVQELAQRAENPVYQPPASFDAAWDKVRGLLDGRCCHLGLFGGRGAGKTATAAAVIERLAEQFKPRGVSPALLCGTCPQPISEPISYAPFCQALAQHFEVNLLAPPGPKLQQISQALGGLFGSVIPFTRILFPHSTGDGDRAARPEEINASIAWMLRRLAKTRPILLFLDDVQWLDGASRGLVEYLLKEFPAGGKTPLAILLVAGDALTLADLGFDAAQSVVEIAYPSMAQQAEILVHGVGLEGAVAQEILVRCGAERESDGGLLWPLQVAARLARCGALLRGKAGFGWANGGWPADFTIPGHIRAAIEEQWESAAAYHAVLGCAACAASGREFHASLLAAALDRSCLEILTVLDEIERKTGIVHDLRDRDDVYAFHSSFLLEAIRGRLGILGHGPRKADVPQIVREYHARLALSLEAARPTAVGGPYEVANHFYAAGARYAAKGVEYCLRAADASAAGYDFQRAGNYLEMAAECADFSGDNALVEAERQMVACQEAQVTLQGRRRAEVAAAGLAYLKDHPAAPPRLVLAVAQVCYDVGHRGHEEKWRDEATGLCQQIAAHPASPQDEAQARHIMAVSQPPERRDERIAELRKAYALLQHAAAADREASRWFAEIVNSLAKELGKGTAAERDEAQRLFELRLQLERERQLGDLRGMAMATAGLGRLQWYHEPKNAAEAEQRFRQNLEISEAIGDITAQVKMHSLLGACALEKSAVEQALSHYQRSLELADDLIDRCYAAVGLLQCHQRQQHLEQFEATAQSLLGWIGRDAIPPDCRNPLLAVLTTCAGEHSSAAIRQLLALVRH
jgi:tetratricopeptide (TPR) repeat protein